MTDARKRVARELRRVKEEATRETLRAREPEPSLPPPPAVREPQAVPREDPPPPEPPLLPPDGARVNESWRAEPPARRGVKGLVLRLLDRLLRSRFEAQQAFNSHQVQLDNDILRYLEERSAATHRHYDQLLGMYSRHLAEVDERHLILQEELVGHVEDLVRRIDLVLERGERGRLSLEHELRDLRRRLEQIETSLRRSRA
jgi:hypothetical protein